MLALISGLNDCSLRAAESADSVDSFVSPNAELTFERDVRPILKTHCFHCHGEEEHLEGGLDVRLRRYLATGGDSGPAVSPGKPDESLLIERLRSGDMPPGDDPAKKVPAADIEIIARWIAAGTVTARAEPEVLTDADLITEEERAWWSFQPIRRPVPPVTRNQGVIRTGDATYFNTCLHVCLLCVCAKACS